MSSIEEIENRLKMLETNFNSMNDMLYKMRDVLIHVIGYNYYEYPTTTPLFGSDCALGNLESNLSRAMKSLSDCIYEAHQDVTEQINELHELISFKFIPVNVPDNERRLNPPIEGEYVVILSNGEIDVRLWNGSHWDEDDEIKVHGWRLQ